VGAAPSAPAGGWAGFVSIAAFQQPAWTVHTEVFDGPLDLLLHLVRRDGIDLRQISIRRIADAYLEYLDKMYEVHLGIAAEYLVLAATLCPLKSLEILPRPPTDASGEEEPVDPRQVLVQRLLDHERFRQAADQLDQQRMLGRDTFAREPAELEGIERPLVAGIDAFGLLDLYHELLRKRSTPEPTYDLRGRGPDIGSCVRRVVERLGGKGGRAIFSEIILDIPTRVERILTFLAVLEMARLQWVQLEQKEHLGDVVLVSQIEVDADLSVVVGRIQMEGGE